MSLRVEDIQKRVAEVFPDVTPVDENVLRFYKRTQNNAPFAVYYLDVAQALPTNEADLRRYVERLIGAHYFEGKSSLQWNNYLYFIRDSQALQQPSVVAAKKLIEDNREYARKFVIREQDIDALLRPDVVEASAATNRVDAASRWIEVLERPHLIEAVFGSYTRADRLKIADGTKSPPKSQPSTLTPAPNAASQLPPLRRFKIDAYRSCLHGREFDFQDVNLLFGVNGAGKTSVLEAIELYYCGKRTKRNPGTEEEYKFEVEVLGKKSGSVTHSSRAEGTFRDRNRDWYGIRELRRSHLCDSFGRFNFLNTDAAVDLARSKDESVNDDLARLLVGSDAAMTWPVIEQLSGDVSADLRRANEARSQTAEELTLLQKQLAESSTVKTESASLGAALRDALMRSQWSVDDHDLEVGAGELTEQLSQLMGAAQQAVKLSWIDAPVTLDKCQRYAATAQEFIKAHESTIQRLESLTARQAELATATTRGQQAANLVDELVRLIEAGVERRASDLAAQRGIVTQTTSLLVGIDDEALAAFTKATKSLSVAECHNAALESRKALEAAANDARRESEQFAKVRQRSVTLGQQLRQLAGQIITEETADECPLCHTNFAPGELARHMASGIDEHVEAAAQKLLADVARLDNEYRRAIATETALGQFVRYCASARLSDVTVSDTLANVTETQTALTDARRRLELLNSETQSLKAEGISLERLNLICSQLNALGFTETHRSPDHVAALRRTIQDNTRASSEEIAATTEAMAQLQASFETSLRPWRTKATDPRGALALLEEQRVTTQEIQSRLVLLSSRFPWQGSRPIGEWIVEGESVRGIAAKLQTALGMERVAAKTLTETISRRDQLQTRSQQLGDRIGRLSEANNALQAVVRDHSLEALTRSALQDNRKGIETIFSQIHSPAEFVAIEVHSDGWKLKRKVGDEHVKLTQISTGQRAAFALSVFLAQNAQLTAGPPVILIDDPIAHVDDLNCLSFLDYLREVALMGKRQIFFATASDKLASLFERKFDFLGGRFKRFNLTRAENA